MPHKQIHFAPNSVYFEHEMITNINSKEIQNKISSGKFSNIVEEHRYAITIRSQDIYAVRVIDKSKITVYNDQVQFKQALSSIRQVMRKNVIHPRVCNFYSIFYEPEKIYLTSVLIMRNK